MVTPAKTMKRSWFGPSSRDISRALREQKVNVLYSQLVEKTTLAIVDCVRQYDPQSEALTSALAVAGTCGSSSSASLLEGRLVLRTHQQIYARRSRELIGKVREWHADSHQELLSDLLATIPLLTHLSGDMATLPTKLGLRMFCYRPAIS